MLDSFLVIFRKTPMYAQSTDWIASGIFCQVAICSCRRAECGSKLSSIDNISLVHTAQPGRSILRYILFYSGVFFMTLFFWREKSFRVERKNYDIFLPSRFSRWKAGEVIFSMGNAIRVGKRQGRFRFLMRRGGKRAYVFPFTKKYVKENVSL